MPYISTALHRICCVILTLVVATLPYVFAFPVRAAEPSLWMHSDNPRFIDPGEILDPRQPITHPNNAVCHVKDTEVLAYGTLPGSTVLYPLKACETITPYGAFYATQTGLVYLKKKWDEHPMLLKFPTGGLLPIPNSPLLMHTQFASGRFTAHFYTNPMGQFLAQRGPSAPLEYSPRTEADWTLRQPSGAPITFKTMTSSQNGQWLLLETGEGLLTRINLETREGLTFHSYAPPSGFGQNPSLQLAVSDDGRYAAMGGFNVPTLTVFDLATCTPQDPSSYTVPSSGCGVRDVAQVVRDHKPDHQVATGLRFNGDASELTFTSGGRRIILVAPGQAAPQLDYLALGDSYSSGEGDTRNDGRNYLTGTDGDGPATEEVNVHKEKCHISSNSYPYLLAQAMSIPTERFRSVACSGATTGDVRGISDQAGKDYLGNFEQITAIDEEDAKSIKQEAVDNFIPGRAGQIAFVEKYKPKVVTISIGGNDIGFDAKLAACAGVGSCRHITPEGLAASANEVDNLYDTLVHTYRELRNASRESKIYAMGYPRFVKETAACLYPNVRFNAEERTYINRGLEYINSIIKNAAQSQGLYYLDIQDAIGESALCGANDDWGVTGLATFLTGNDIQLGPLWFAQESYHPNARGHALIAAAIKQQVPSLLSPPCPQAASNWRDCSSTTPAKPTTPAYFDAPLFQPTPWFFPIYPNGIIPKTTNAEMQFSLNGLPPNTAVRGQIMSEPTDLGTFTTDGNGNLSGTAVLPASVPAGQHTLHFTFTSPTGAAYDLYQPVLVVGPDGDVDEDGLADTADPCLFVEASNTDHDQDGRDDACDGDIGEPPVIPEPALPLYRARNGDATRGEASVHIYIERHIAEAKKRLNLDDHDPDGDGWSLVGRSKGESKGALAHFWIDESGIPHASTRNPKKGCLQLMPASLGVVAPDEKRRLSIEAENTSTCRGTEPQTDTDQDGQPDNTQTLYRVRRGDPARQESTKQLLLERNTTAAEAQLGVSDFDKDGDGWALLGKSSSLKLSDSALPALRVLSGDQLYVTIRDTKNTCLVLQPDSLRLITKGKNQALAIVANPPAEVTCES